MTSLGTISARSYPDYSCSHKHDHHQAIIALDGSLDLESDVSKGVVDKGVFAFVPAGNRHEFRGRGQNCLLTFNISPEHLGSKYFTEDLLENRHFFPVSSEFQGLISFISGTFSSFQNEDFRNAVSIMVDHGIQNSLRVPPSKHQAFFARIKAFILSNIHRNLTCVEVAAALNSSVPTVNRALLGQVGMPYGRYARQLRLEHAKYLIRSSTLSLSEIALACGYSEQSALTRAIQREMHVTPRSLRSQLK